MNRGKHVRSLAIVTGMALGLASAHLPAIAQKIQPPRIAFEKVVLDNGLTVILHEDHATPIVAVNLWYHVGSKNEKAGRTGFAHLFEHMMFQGSSHHDTDFFKALEPVGATDLNGTTNFDRTNYFENVPPNALEMNMWLEADRMGWLLPAMTQDRLDNQREVVKNERRQSYENQPYGLVNERMFAALYPKNHPYSWPVIGSMDDLTAAAKSDVESFFKSYYSPNNCTLVIAGDMSIDTTKELVKKYFGDIPPGPPIARPEAWVPHLDGEIRLSMEDRVPLPRLYVAWHVPGIFQENTEALDMLTDILAGDKNSRLYKRLVYDLQIAQNVNAFIDQRELSSLFRVTVTARAGHSLDEIEPLVFEEITKLTTTPPTAAETERVRTTHLARVVRGLDRIGGFGGKSDILGWCQTYTGDAGCLTDIFRRYNAVTPAALHAAARRWLGSGRVVMRVDPFPDLAPGARLASLDRSRMPAVGEPLPLKLPATRRATLSNGLGVVVASTDKVPVVRLNLIVRGGASSDQKAQFGLASLMANVMDEGTSTRTALELDAAEQALGAQLFTSSNLDTWTVTLSAMKARLAPSMDLWADVILHPVFPAKEVDRLRKQVIGQIMQEKRQPVGMATRILPALLYGSQHPYGQPLSGSGFENIIESLTRQDLVDTHDTWFKPGNATVVVVGDTTREEIVPMLEGVLGKWTRGRVPLINLPARPLPEHTTVYLIDKPGAAQSVLFAGTLTPPKNNPDDVPFQVLNAILGGQFTSRLNMNLREDKGYSYGAFSAYLPARGQGLFGGFSMVRTDVTKESIVEMMREIRDIRAERPVTPQELEQAQDNLTLSLPGRY
ncbi:MAG: M16 family metallopeptidase, partial [Acidobacteriota bacterium]